VIDLNKAISCEAFIDFALINEHFVSNLL